MKPGEFAELYQAEARSLIRFAATLVGLAHAEDVVSDAVVSAMGRLVDDGGAGARSVKHPRAYLFRAVANAGAKHWRRTGRRHCWEALAAAAIGADGADGDDASAEMVRALGSLSVQQRAVIHLTYWEDLAPSGVAHHLGVSEGSVRRQLARARAKLRKDLSPSTSVGSVLGGEL